jgi:hypothetical protein
VCRDVCVCVDVVYSCFFVMVNIIANWVGRVLASPSPLLSLYVPFHSYISI